MGSKSTPQQTTQSTNTNMGPWQAQQPYLTDVFQQAQNLYNQPGPQYYKDSTIAPMNAAQNSGLNSIIGMQGQLAPLSGALQQGTTDTLQGKYLDPSTNPYLAKTYGQAADQVTRSYQTATAPQTSAAYTAAGRYGSGARNQSVDQNNRALGTSLDNLATSIYGGNYGQERQNMLNTANNAGNIQSALYQPAGATVAAGGQQQQQSQAELQDLVNRWNFNQQQPYQKLQAYQGAVGGNYGQSGTSTTTGTQNVYSNPLGSALGAGLGIASLFAPGMGGTSAAGNIGSGIASWFR